MGSTIVQTNDGKLEGIVSTDIDGGQFYSFLGIPYAKPPIRELRFKAPQPIDPWQGVKDATQEGPICIQKNLLNKQIEGSEDCLHLNVFTKSINHGENLKPVMVWIYGGAFTNGSNSRRFYGPTYLLTEDIVLVAVNYRIGILGFLSIDDISLDVPGNAGLKDQNLALKWVQRNIKCFNGDPNNVTIFGESAGAASVHYHLLSPASKGLFHKAIMQSGCSLSVWAYILRNVMEFVKLNGQESKTEKEALEFLRNVTVDELYAMQEHYQTVIKENFVIFGPVIEKPNETAFITNKPMDILASGEYNKVPLILGYTTNEGMLFEVEKQLNKVEGKRNEESYDIGKLIFKHLNIEMGSELGKVVEKKISDIYSLKTDPNGLLVLLGDIYFVLDILKASKYHAATSPVYLYRMSLTAGLNFLKKMAKVDHLPGACHGDDIGYLFDNFISKLEKGSNEEIYVKRFVKLWTNFAKYSNPTPNEEELNVKWNSIQNDCLNFLDIGEALTMEANPEEPRLQVWREITQMAKTK